MLINPPPFSIFELDESAVNVCTKPALFLRFDAQDLALDPSPVQDYVDYRQDKKAQTSPGVQVSHLLGVLQFAGQFVQQHCHRSNQHSDKQEDIEEL